MCCKPGRARVWRVNNAATGAGQASIWLPLLPGTLGLLLLGDTVSALPASVGLVPRQSLARRAITQQLGRKACIPFVTCSISLLLTTPPS